MATTLKLGSMAVLLMGLQAIALGIDPAGAEVGSELQFQSPTQWSAFPGIIFNAKDDEDPDMDLGGPDGTGGAGGRCADFLH